MSVLTLRLAKLPGCRGIVSRRGGRQRVRALGRRYWIGQVTVRRVNGKYELLAGHRRRLAVIEAGLSTVLAVVEDLDDQAAREYVLLDNLNREDFLPWEDGAGFQQLAEVGLLVEAIAQKAGRSASYVTGRIALEQEAGGKLRAAYLAREINLASLLLLSKLPCRRQC